MAPILGAMAQTAQAARRLLKSAEVAATLNVSRATVGRLRADGTLTPVRLRRGDNPHYRADEVAELLDRRRRR